MNTRDCTFFLGGLFTCLALYLIAPAIADVMTKDEPTVTLPRCATAQRPEPTPKTNAQAYAIGWKEGVIWANGKHAGRSELKWRDALQKDSAAFSSFQ